MNKLFFSTLMACCLATPFSFANEKDKSKMPPMEWTAVQRENMAKMHENMATCLRSAKTMKECHAEMKDFCKGKSKDECPMHDKMHRM